MAKHRWYCPKCGNAFITEVELTTPPTCYGHSGKVYQMLLTGGPK
jgi:predicted nucleic-acid-binding Zn-ribbon protein